MAAPTVKAERNVGSSPVREAVSGVRPPGAVLRPGLCAQGRRATDDLIGAPKPVQMQDHRSLSAPSKPAYGRWQTGIDPLIVEGSHHHDR